MSTRWMTSLILASTLALPFVFPMLLWGETWGVVPLMIVVTALTNTYLGPCLATCHALVPPAMRALASAILFFILNLIGLGMGPLTAGALSDYFSAEYGLDGFKPRDSSAIRQSKREALDQAYASHVFGFLTRLARLLITTAGDEIFIGLNRLPLG